MLLRQPGRAKSGRANPDPIGLTGLFDDSYKHRRQCSNNQNWIAADDGPRQGVQGRLIDGARIVLVARLSLISP